MENELGNRKLLWRGSKERHVSCSAPTQLCDSAPPQPCRVPHHLAKRALPLAAGRPPLTPRSPGPPVRARPATGAAAWSGVRPPPPPPEGAAGPPSLLGLPPPCLAAVSLRVPAFIPTANSLSWALVLNGEDVFVLVYVLEPFTGKPGGY